MEMFNVHRRDILNFDNYMDLKKPGFGGPNSAEQYRDTKGKKLNKDPRLADYQRVVSRDAAFSNPVYDPTYKAMTHDLVYKQENKKPFTYTDPYSTGLPVVNVSPIKEGKSYTSFNSFITESEETEKLVSLRGKTDADAIGDAEDKLDASRIEWNDYGNKSRERIDYLDKDGDLVAYVDIPKRKLVIMPDAPIMSDLASAPEEFTEPEEEYTDTQAEEEEEERDEYYTIDAEETEELDEPEIEKEEVISSPSSSEDVKEIERILKSFETPEEEEDIDDEETEY